MVQASEDAQPEYITLGAIRLILNNSRLPPTTRAALTRGRYEFKEREVAKMLLAAGDRVVELGTGMGAVCLSIASQIGEDAIVSFEANPTIAELARRNAEINGMRVDIRNAIPCPRRLGREGETMDFFAFRAFEASSVRKLAPGVQAIQVPTAVLEDEIEAHRANVLVFDVEGFEKEIITLANLERIDKIVLELHPAILGEAETVQLVGDLEAQGLKLAPDLLFGNVAGFARQDTGCDGASIYARTLELEMALKNREAEKAKAIARELTPILSGNTFFMERLGQIAAQFKAAGLNF